jgi:hypothetical protein
MSDQALVLVRQVIEMCSVIIHIVSDQKATALDNFRSGKYASTKSISTAKKAVPFIGLLWGFLSEHFVHITEHHTLIRPLKPYGPENEDVEAVINFLRMTIWVCYVTTELAFHSSRSDNRYWKIKVHGGRQFVAFEPSDEENAWSDSFLGLDAEVPEFHKGEEIDSWQLST